MIVVADTSVFLNLGRIRQEELLPALYGDVFAPPEVRREFLDAVQRYARFRECHEVRGVRRLNTACLLVRQNNCP